MTIATTKAELQLALDEIQPQIRGMQDLMAVSLSAETLALVQTELTDRLRRESLLLAAIGALEALEADGYPELAPGAATAAAYEELQGQLADIQAAMGEFALAASQMTITLGSPTQKEQ